MRYITDYLLRFHPRYIRSLVYMMQSSEYYARDFWNWYKRTSNFLEVEKRKQLDVTLKAKVLLLCGYGLSTIGILISLTIAITGSSIGLFLGICLLFALPIVLPYALVAAMVTLNRFQKPVENHRIATAREKLRKHPGIRIGIAGSFGKTTMREILKTVLGAKKKVAAPGGSRNTPLGIAEFIESLKGDEEILIFEFGEYYPGDIQKLCEFIDPQWAIITGVNEAHLERFETIEKTTATIFELADYAPHKPLYINGESARARTRATSRGTVYDRTGAGEWRVIAAETDLDGLRITFQQHGKKFETRSQLLGLHTVGPLSAAADIASKLGLWQEDIMVAIAATRPFEHRMQPKTDGGVTLIDDSYNGNPDGVMAAIDFLATLEGRRRIFVTPGLVEMGARKDDIHRAIGRQLAEAKIEKVVLIRDSVTPWIAEGLQQAKYQGELIWFDSGPAAFKAIPNMTVSGDVVLIQNDWPDQYA